MQLHNEIFLVEERQSKPITFEKLFQDICKCSSVPKYFRFESLYDLYLHLIVAIINSNHIVLLDNDFSDEEIKKIVGDNTFLEESYVTSMNLSALTKEILLDKIFQSTAEITLFTSGTTGQPKRVVHKVKNFLSSVKIDSKFSESIWALAYNPTHMAGLQVFFQSICNFNTLINVFQQTKEYLITAATQFEITHISATPTFYRLLFPPDFNLPSIKNVTVGGEKSDALLIEKLKIIFPKAKLTNIYASTEAGALFYSNGDVFKIREEIAHLIKIESQKLFVAISLLGNIDNIAQGEWYDTGDLVQIVTEQPLSFRFVSRSNEMINVGGNKVNPIEIESLLLTISGVRNALVYGKANSVLGNMLIAEIEVEKEINTKDVRDYLSKNIQDFKVPRIIKIVDKIATTRTGKLKRTE